MSEDAEPLFHADPGDPGEPEGTVTADDAVIADLARREARSCAGITAFSPAFLDGLRGGRSRGTRVTRDERGVIIEMRVSVAHGTDCVKLFNELRRRVARKIKEVTGLFPAAVNLRITDIRDKGPDDELDLDDPDIDF